MSIRARTWMALAIPPFSWFLFEQGLSALLHADCTLAPWGILWGVATLALCGVAAWIAWPLRRHEGALVNPWLARLTLALAGVFGLAALFQTLAVLLVPACAG